METKKIYQSKTIQFNTIAPLLSYGLAMAGLSVPAEVQVAILSVGNWLLRLITKKPIG